MTDQCAATTAGLPRTSVYPETVLRLGVIRRTALLSAIGNNSVARIFQNVGSHEPLGCRNECLNLLIEKCGDKAERVHAFHEAEFRLEYVSNAGHHILMEQHFPDFLITTVVDANRRGLRIEGFVQNV